MDRNIKIAYLLAICKNSWFWLGIWVFYYLKFTNYAGIGVIETSLVIAMTVSEIPTGAVADLLGKKKTLIISFLLQAVGGFMMALATNSWWLVISVAIMGVGGSFYSGTLEALVYDSLREKNKQGAYDKIISRINAIGLATPAVCGIIGGYLYKLRPSLPFLANSVFYSLAIIFCFYLIEPKIDSLRFSFSNFINQTKLGVFELRKNKFVLNQTILLLSVGVIIVVCDEMLNSFLGVEFGFNAQQLGILWSVIYLASAFASHYTPIIKKLTNYRNATVVIGLVIAITLVASPALGLVLGGVSLLIRSCLQAVYGNISSVLINQQTESDRRATTLSTFNLVKNIPYVLTAFLLGYLADIVTAVNLAAILGSVLVVLVIIQLPNFRKQISVDSVKSG